MDWEDKLKRYCEEYNIPLDYLANTLYEPKVVPMVRGKAFEFSAMIALQDILGTATWAVSKTPMNAQQGAHDIDVEITHLPTERTINAECKLAKKGGFRANAPGGAHIPVKCMRSRTLGAAMVAQLAPRLGVDPGQLMVHNDQYLPNDFDVVITSIGNAFYETDPETGIFTWAPSEAARAFLERLRATYEVSPEVSLKDFAFSQMYIAKAADLAVANNGIECGRRGCTNRTACGFIPNYPVITFDATTLAPAHPWYHLNDASRVLRDFL